MVQRQVLWTTKPSSFADVFPPVFPPTRGGRVRLSAAHRVRGNKSPRWQFRQSKNNKKKMQRKQRQVANWLEMGWYGWWVTIGLEIEI